MQSRFSEVNQSLEEMAIVFAKSLDDKSVREFIKSEAGKQFDGDYNILFKTASSARLANSGKSLLEKLAESEVSNQARARRTISVQDARRAVETNAAKIPVFNIGVPYFTFDQWDAATFTPLATYKPVGIDDMKLETVRAFDANGNVRIINVKEWRKNPYPLVVLGVNDRVDESGKVRNGLIFARSNAKANSVASKDTMKVSLIAPEEGSPGGGRQIVPGRKYLYMRNIQVWIDSWDTFDGPEFYLRVSSSPVPFYHWFDGWQSGAGLSGPFYMQIQGEPANNPSGDMVIGDRRRGYHNYNAIIADETEIGKYITFLESDYYESFFYGDGEIVQFLWEMPFNTQYGTRWQDQVQLHSGTALYKGARGSGYYGDYFNRNVDFWAEWVQH